MMVNLQVFSFVFRKKKENEFVIVMEQLADCVKYINTQKTDLVINIQIRFTETI